MASQIFFIPILRRMRHFLRAHAVSYRCMGMRPEGAKEEMAFFHFANISSFFGKEYLFIESRSYRKYYGN